MYINTYNGNYGFKGVKSHGTSSAFAPSGIEHAKTAGQVINVPSVTYNVPITGTSTPNGTLKFSLAPYISPPLNSQILSSYFVSPDVTAAAEVASISVGDSTLLDTLLDVTIPSELNTGAFGKSIVLNNNVVPLFIYVDTNTPSVAVTFNMSITFLYVIPPNTSI